MLVSVVLVLAALEVAVLWAASIEPEPSRSTDAAAFYGALTGFVGGLFVHVAVHELGHLVAAWTVRLNVLGVQIWGLRFGAPRSSLPGSSGHVLFEIGRAQRRVPLRVILVMVAGPAANVVAAVATAAVVAGGAGTTAFRAGAVGFTVAGLLMAGENLLPWRTAKGRATDGLSALRWMFRTEAQRARIALEADLARVQIPPTPPGGEGAERRRDRLLAAIADPRPDVAVSGMTELLRRRPRYDDGWRDVEVVAGFASRSDVDADVRARVSGNYAVSLALAHLRALRPGASTVPNSSEVRRLVHLAELAHAADRESLPARTAIGLVRVIQGRLSEARAVLVEVPASAPPPEQARAYAVHGIAEAELGDHASAARSVSIAREMSPDEPLLTVLDAVLAQQESR